MRAVVNWNAAQDDFVVPKANAYKGRVQTGTAVPWNRPVVPESARLDAGMILNSLVGNPLVPRTDMFRAAGL